MRIILALFFFCFYSYALAADLPPGQEPGAQAERYKYDVDKEKKGLEYKKPKVSEKKMEQGKVEPAKGGASFVLTEVKITGATFF